MGLIDPSDRQRQAQLDYILKRAQLSKLLGQQSAQSGLLGGTDPNSAVPDANWSPMPTQAPQTAQVQDPSGNWQRIPNTQQGLLGAGVPQDQVTPGGLMGHTQADVDQQRQGLLNQASPDYAMTMMQRKPMLDALPPDQRQAAMMNFDEFSKRAIDQAIPAASPDVQAISQAQATVDKLGKDNPLAKPYLDFIAEKSGGLKGAEQAETGRHNKAEEGKPVNLGNGSYAQFVNGKWEIKGGFGEPDDRPRDPENPNLGAQVGLSDLAIKQLTGQTQGMRLSQAQSRALNAEIDTWATKNGINTATMRSQAKGLNDVLEFNVKRNKQGEVLENELAGTIDNLQPIMEQIGQGRIKFENVLRVWKGEQINDGPTIQAADQLGRLRQELAGYNAVAGGNLMENGTPKITPEDFKSAEHIISNGISGGGLGSLKQSVQMSAEKNKNILLDSIDKTNSDFYSLFGGQYRAPKRSGAGSPSAPRNTPASGGGFVEGQTATNPQTKEKLVYHAGKWVPLK